MEKNLERVLFDVTSYVAEKYPLYETSLKKELSAITGYPFSKSIVKSEKKYTYSGLQMTLADCNESELSKKERGVYYTPYDVVNFIVGDVLQIASHNFIIEFATVFDPACGMGEFLLNALERKLYRLPANGKKAQKATVKQVVSSIYGNDIDEDAVSIAKLRLFLCVLERCGAENCLGLSSILNKNFTHLDFVSSRPEMCHNFEVIVGNPPYVEDSKCGLKLSEHFGNIYANVLEYSAELLDPLGVMGFLIPLSFMSTPRMKHIRDELYGLVPKQDIFSYADRPGTLFKGVHQKFCIFLGQKTESPEVQVFTSNYKFWYQEEREQLFKQRTLVRNEFVADSYIPKLGNFTDLSIYRKVISDEGHKPLSEFATGGSESVYLNTSGATYWVKAFRGPHEGSGYKALSCRNARVADYVFCLLNSSLFWWYWLIISDGWHVTSKELNGFMVPPLKRTTRFTTLAGSLERKLEDTKKYINSKQVVYEYKHKDCLDEIHAIDDYINPLFGLTDEESGYIKQYAIKYRTGDVLSCG